MTSEKKAGDESGADNGKAPWILMATTVNLDKDDQSEQMALVRTPEGDRWVPMSEARGRFNLFEQLPEYQKEQFARWVFEAIREQQEEEKRAEPQAAREARDDE